MAHFDRRLGHTKLVAIVRHPFRISDRVKNLDDGDEMARFLTDYRAAFAQYVRAAAALSARS